MTQLAKITQDDRNAAWPFRPSCYKDDQLTRERWNNGAYDKSAPSIQAFAQVRKEAIEQAAEAVQLMQISSIGLGEWDTDTYFQTKRQCVRHINSLFNTAPEYAIESISTETCSDTEALTLGEKNQEKCVIVCPQCDGECEYPDGIDEDACSIQCTRCEGMGAIVDIAALSAAPAQVERVKPPNDAIVHMRHCDIGDYEGSCKYGEDDCPALTHPTATPSTDTQSTAFPREEVARIIMADMGYEYTGKQSLCDQADSLFSGHPRVNKAVNLADQIADAIGNKATPSTDVEAVRLRKAIEEAMALINEINQRKSSRSFYTIDQALHSKLCTIRATLQRSLAHQGEQS